ncbi:MAG: hypothetical protein CFH34_01671 [Alphaproteobacteria bacterium MarineAlpha9_Bin4]|nr:MAG: hypothetical protein CFH34_01671 [Alphaproteobacteria bacterium MarineAlpha9_Bin4]
MTTLNQITTPKSIAIVGASDNKNRIGGRPLSHMIEQNFEGTVYPVNPNRDKVQGLKSYPNLQDIPGDLDFVLIAVPAKFVVNVIEDAVKKNARTALIFSSGFSEIGGEGEVYQKKIREICDQSNLRVIGPNCLGLFNSQSRFYPTFTSTIDRATPIPGDISIASQSGAYGSHIYMVSHQRGLGIRYWITTGNEADLSVGEAIQLLAEDDNVHTIMAYVESVKNGKQFINALETARQEKKPVILMKVGRSDVGAAAANSHTASLAGEDAIYEEVVRAHGAYRVRSTEEMLDVAYATKPKIYPTGKNLGIVTISGGGGVLMADAASDVGLKVGAMPEGAQKELKEIVPFASPMNPVDVTAQFFNDLSIVPKFIDLMLSQGGYDGIIGFWTSVAGSPKMSQPLLNALKQAMSNYSEKIFINSMVASEDIVKHYEKEGFLSIEDPTRAVVSMAALMYFGEKFNEKIEKIEIQPPLKINIPKRNLNEIECVEILEKFDINLNKGKLIKNVQEIKNIYKDIEDGYVMKVVSKDIQHKTEIGGISINIKSLIEAETKYDEILQNVKTKSPKALIDGVMISPMIKGGVEAILGAKVDPVFGPVVMFGLGGIYTEVLKDISFAEAPLNKKLAKKMISRLKSAKMFEGARGLKLNLDHLLDNIVKLSEFIYIYKDFVKEVEMNPLVIKEDMVIGLDALIIPNLEGEKNA